MNGFNETDDSSSRSERILSLIALCGELPTSQISRLSGGEAYNRKVITKLKKERKIKLFGKDELYGFRLLQSGKDMLLRANPDRFSFYLTGTSTTNHIRSEYTRRLRLHRLAETILTATNAEVEIFRDRKTPIFAVERVYGEVVLPSFYSSLEINALGDDAIKIKGSRAMGVLLTEGRIFAVYNLGDSLMKWENNIETRFKTMMRNILCQERLCDYYSSECIEGLILSNSMTFAGEIFKQSGNSTYLNSGYEHFHFLTNDRRGERILTLLCNPELRSALDEILSDDLSPRNPSLAIENDAVDELGNPVLFAYSCDLPRLKRFDTAIRIKGMSGTVICFDFQKPTLAEVLSDKIHFQTISFEKWEGVFLKKSKRIILILTLTVLLFVALYIGGLIGQFASGYAEWQSGGGTLGDGTSPRFPSLNAWSCIRSSFTFPYGFAGTAICLVAIGAVVLYFYLTDNNGELDKERNFHYSDKGTYGTSGFMSEKEAGEILDLVGDLNDHSGTVLGILNGKYVCVPHETRLNANMAVYGASGSMKTRSFCVNRILQSAARGESLVCCDPKSELYEKTSSYMREKGYTVKVFNLVSPENSDSWNCLGEIEGDELMAQLFCDVVIKNTGSEKGDHFWDSSEQNLLKAVSLSYPKNKRNIGEVYKLLSMCTEQELNALFEVLPYTHPAKAPFTIFKQASEKVRSGVIIGLGSRLQVFQNKKICDMTSHDEIDMELPGKRPCIYYCINSDQDSTFDFLASLFLSFVFIKLVRFADNKCEGGKLPVPVHVLGEELTACGVIPDLSRKISVIRSRNISMSCVFQNLAGLQNRYPQNQWQEILGNSDIQLFLGCVDELTARYISDRSGEVSIQVQSQARERNIWRPLYTPDYREMSGIGKRKLLTMDEVLRLPITQALVIVRGKKLLKVDKCDYSLHPESKKLKPSKASEHIPDWRSGETVEVKSTVAVEEKKEKSKPTVKLTDKKSIMNKE